MSDLRPHWVRSLQPKCTRLSSAFKIFCVHLGNRDEVDSPLVVTEEVSSVVSTRDRLVSLIYRIRQELRIKRSETCGQLYNKLQKYRTQLCTAKRIGLVWWWPTHFKHTSQVDRYKNFSILPMCYGTGFAQKCFYGQFNSFSDDLNSWGFLAITVQPDCFVKTGVADEIVLLDHWWIF